MEYIVRVDDRGRISIPSDVRKLLGIKHYIRLRVADGKVILEPVKDPLDDLVNLAAEVAVKASQRPEELSKLASEELMRESRS